MICRRHTTKVVLPLLFFHNLLFFWSAAAMVLTAKTSLSTTQPFATSLNVNRPSRRQLVTASCAYATIASSSASSLRPAFAFGFHSENQNQRRRQVELCLVAIQRVAYWADRQATALLDNNNSSSSSEQRRKELYLESRVGAKAILTSKGSGYNTYTLGTLNIPACLADLEWHARQELSKSLAGNVEDAKQRFTEGLASIVEFDGLETLTDPSPRPTLTLAQYTDAKALFVVRSFRESVLPASRQLLQSFGTEPLETAQRYIEQYYSSEIPPPSEYHK
jgi:hypothetical protein